MGQARAWTTACSDGSDRLRGLLHVGRLAHVIPFPMRRGPAEGLARVGASPSSAVGRGRTGTRGGARQPPVRRARRARSRDARRWRRDTGRARSRQRGRAGSVWWSSTRCATSRDSRAPRPRADHPPTRPARGQPPGRPRAESTRVESRPIAGARKAPRNASSARKTTGGAWGHARAGCWCPARSCRARAPTRCGDGRRRHTPAAAPPRDGP